MKLVSYDTTSDEHAGTCPSTPGQWELARELVRQLSALGAQNARVDEHCYVYAEIPANCAKSLPVLGLIAHMKKSRPGLLLCALCREPEKDAVVSAFFRHTTTLGVRETPCRRYTLARRELVRQTPLGPVRVKCAEGFGAAREKYEYEDLARLAREQGLSLEAVRQRLASRQELQIEPAADGSCCK